MVHKQGSLSVFVLTILQYVGIYGEANPAGGAGTEARDPDSATWRNARARSTIWWKKRKYAAAIRGYDMLLETWNHLEQEGKELPAGKVRAAILHNKGVALTGLMFYDKAAYFLTKPGRRIRTEAIWMPIWRQREWN